MALVPAPMGLKAQGPACPGAEASVRVAVVPDLLLNEMQSLWLEGWRVGGRWN